MLACNWHIQLNFSRKNMTNSSQSHHNPPIYNAIERLYDALERVEHKIASANTGSGIDSGNYELVEENIALRQRIRELEQQYSELQSTGQALSQKLDKHLERIAQILAE